MNAVEFRRVTVRYGSAPAASDVSLTVAAGEWLALVGPNGAGKSSLLRAVAGVVPYSGSITVGGDEVARLGRRPLARRVALVPQNPVLPTGVTVFDYVLLGRTPHIKFFGVETVGDENAAAAALRRLDLEDLAMRTMDRLSGGEAQRAVVARALAQEAGLLILDEPTTSLDLGHRHQLLELVGRLRDEGEAVVAAFHDLSAVTAYADRVALLYGGVVMASGTSGEVLTPGRIRDAYGVEVTILHDDAGRPVVVPKSNGKRHH